MSTILSKDSVQTFADQWSRSALPIPLAAAGADDLYTAYRHWCVVNKVSFPAQATTFLGGVCRVAGFRKTRNRVMRLLNTFQARQVVQTVVWPAGVDAEVPGCELTAQLREFEVAVTAWRGAA